MYTGLVQACSDKETTFYFKPNSKRFAFDKQPVGILTSSITYYPRRAKKEALGARLATVSE